LQSINLNQQRKTNVTDQYPNRPFQATAYHNGKFVPVSEENFKGKWSVVVFYPADFTFVCPTELGDLADHYDEFKRLGVEIYGVSTDTHFTHKAWHDTSDTIRKVKYPLVGDPGHQLASFFQVLITEGDDAGLALRGTFVIDPQGRIKTIEVHDNGIGPRRQGNTAPREGSPVHCRPPRRSVPAKWSEGARR
jgi:peroxiredoxin (alkyl hydroperoxide reductase subunit C)